jgi:MarR family transcriptional regulator, lower aerobic nicotinate degradation pathway regulator
MNAPGPQIPLETRRPGPPKELLTSPTFLAKRVGFAIKERMMEAFEESGLSMYDHAILTLLDEEPTETQAQIADALGYDRSQLVGLLDELEQKGLVERRRDPDDRRRHVVSLTPAGKKTYARLREVAKQLDEEFLAPLDAAERKTLHALLLELAAYHDPRCGGAPHETD